MQIVTTDFITGKEIETIQVVKGSVVFSKNVVRDVFAGLKTLVGGEIAGYTDAVVNVRFATSSVMAGSSEIIVYGTAVKFSDRSR